MMTTRSTPWRVSPSPPTREMSKNMGMLGLLWNSAMHRSLTATGMLPSTRQNSHPRLSTSSYPTRRPLLL